MPSHADWFQTASRNNILSRNKCQKARNASASFGDDNGDDDDLDTSAGATIADLPNTSFRQARSTNIIDVPNTTLQGAQSNIQPAAKAGYLMAHGLQGAPPEVKAAVATAIVNSPAARSGMAAGIASVHKSIWRRLLDWLHL